MHSFWTEMASLWFKGLHSQQYGLQYEKSTFLYGTHGTCTARSRHAIHWRRVISFSYWSTPQSSGVRDLRIDRSCSSMIQRGATVRHIWIWRWRGKGRGGEVDQKTSLKRRLLHVNSTCETHSVLSLSYYVNTSPLFQKTFETSLGNCFGMMTSVTDRGGRIWEGGELSKVI